MQEQDRFKKISDTYDLFGEVFAESGVDSNKLQRTVYETVVSFFPQKEISILDIGTGNGLTVKSFIDNGYTNIIAIDLNPQMIEQAEKNFPNKARFIQMNALDMPDFSPRQFKAIISGMALHNIAKEDRKKLWKELRRLEPEVFVNMDKIADADINKHCAAYDKETKAIERVYKDKYGLEEENKIWQEHYVYDEKEKMTLEEIKENLGDEYKISVVYETGMCKTVVAKRV